MSKLRQRPDHLIIREYVRDLLVERKIGQEALRDAFVPIYLDMTPPGEDAPKFEAVHRHDPADVAVRKDATNLKKLWRAIDGVTFFPLAFKAPLIAALELLEPGLGVDLHKLLLHNAGLYYLNIDIVGDGPVVYAEWLGVIAKANAQVVSDIADDGVLSAPKTRKELLDLIEKSLQVLRELDANTEGAGSA